MKAGMPEIVVCIYKLINISDTLMVDSVDNPELIKWKKFKITYKTL